MIIQRTFFVIVQICIKKVKILLLGQRGDQARLFPHIILELLDIL